MRPKDPIVYLVAGGVGAGKSTYSKRLVERVGGVHLAVDEWMVSLFAPDMNDPLDWSWIHERSLRCEDQIVAMSGVLARAGVPSILEIGLQTSQRRAEIASLLTENGQRFETHFLDVETSERWRRVQRRNQAEKELTISRSVFDFFESMWERPTSEEPIHLSNVDNL